MERFTCNECGAELEPGASLCGKCGFDLTTSVARPRRRSPVAVLASVVGRLLLYGLLVGLPVAGFMRLRATGPAEDLPTTLRWMAFGDGGRSAELVTIHRAFEIASATARYAIEEQEAPSLEGDWAGLLEPYATMNVRGFVPLLFWASNTDLAPASVKELYTVSDRDGWGRLYRLTARALPIGDGADPQVAADLEEGLSTSFFAAGRPDLERGEWVRLEVLSAGADGGYGTADDLRLISYLPVGVTLHLGASAEELQRTLDRAFILGRHHFRLEGSRFDLIDARLLAEFRLESVT